MDFSNFDIELLDAYERHVYNDRLKNGFTKDEALEFIVASTEGDYSQLSDGLKEFVEAIN